MTQEESDYISYLLRLWLVHEEVGPVWRASLTSPHTGERQGYPNLDALITFLRTEIEAAQAAQDDSDRAADT